jgi:hypothetical protein
VREILDKPVLYRESDRQKHCRHPRRQISSPRNAAIRQTTNRSICGANEVMTSSILSGCGPAGAPPMAPQMAPPPPPVRGGNSMGMPGPNTGGPGLTPYSGGAPPR